MSGRLRPVQAHLPGDRYRYQDVVERHFVIMAQSGPEAMVACMWHENNNTPALRINMDTGLYLCFSCHASGNHVSLLRAVGERVTEMVYDVSDITDRLNALDLHLDTQTQLRPIPDSALIRYRFNPRYWQGRGFTDETIAKFDLGFDMLNDMATIALRDHTGDLIGFIKRDMDPDASPRYRYPKHFRKSWELFASWLATDYDSDTVVLVEGAVDAMKVWQAGHCAVAQYGSSLSVEQIQLLRRMGFTDVVTFFDNDTAGRAATQYALGNAKHRRNGKTLTEYRPAFDLRRDFAVRTVGYRPGWKSDPGAMDEITIRNAIADAKPIM